MKMKIVEKPLWLRIIIGLVLGIAAGVVLSPGVGLIGTEDMLTLAPWVAMPGNLFLSLVKMIMMPLVLSSIVLGISSSGDKSFLGRAASRVVPYFVMTTVVAVSIGALVATAMEPGKHFDQELVAQLMEGSPKAEQAPPPVAEREDLAIPDRIVRLIPTNYIQSRLDQDVLATVIIGLFLGTAMVFAAPKKVAGLGDFFVGLQEVSLRIVDWAMMLAPLAVFSLICQVVMRVGLDAVLGMAAYMASVLIGLLLLVVFYLILGVDRILDMCRTSVNVTGDLTAVTIMDRWLGKSKQEAGETEGETGGLSPSAAP